MDETPGTLVLEGVQKSWGDRPAVDDFSLTVTAGHSVALIGPSGCGKSTVLRLIAGLLTPDRGSIRFGGLDCVPGNYARLRDRLGYVIQDGGLFPHLTAFDNVTLKARDRDGAGAQLTERVRTLAELTHVPPELLSRYPAQLSGGQRQRVGLMRALMHDPELLLMDEPLGALDPIVRSRLQVELRQTFSRLRKTVVFVTHDLAEAAFLCDEIVLMREGAVVQRGRMSDLRTRPADAFVEEFVRAQQGHGLEAGA